MSLTATQTSRLYNQPIPVVWCGFRSDTLQMQRAGWQISAEQDIRTQTMRLAFQFSESGISRCQGLTRAVPWHYDDFDFWRHVEPLVIMFGPEIIVQEMGPVMPSNWFAVDARPELAPTRMVNLEDLAHFRIPNDIIIPEDCVSDLLDRALKVQQPIRDEEMARRARRNHGSLITLA